MIGSGFQELASTKGLYFRLRFMDHPYIGGMSLKLAQKYKPRNETGNQGNSCSKEDWPGLLPWRLSWPTAHPATSESSSLSPFGKKTDLLCFQVQPHSAAIGILHRSSHSITTTKIRTFFSKPLYIGIFQKVRIHGKIDLFVHNR